MKVFFFISLIIFCPLHGLFAQEAAPSSPWNVGASAHYGSILPHSNAIRLIADSNPWGMQVDVSRHINTQQVWEQCKCYPKIGGSLAYFNYDNPEILGSSVNLITFIEPYITYKYRINPSFRLGAGISYLNNVYDSITNPENLFYSSPISFIILANVSVNIRVNPQWNLFIGANFNHISNGRIKQPNKGINFPTLSIGTNYYLTPATFPDRKSEKPLKEIYPSRWKANVAFFTALKEAGEGEPKQAVLGLNGSVGRILTRLNSINTGVEWLYDYSIEKHNQRGKQETGAPSVWAYLLGHELLMGNFSFTQTLGFYFNKPYPSEDPFFHRWGLYYTVKNSYYFGFNLKVHGQTADFLDFRIGIVI